MGVTVAGQLVAAVDDAPHQCRIALGDPAQGEEGGAGLVCLQQRQDQVDVAFDPARLCRPLRAGDVAVEGRDLEVVLDIDRQRVAPLAGAAHGRLSWRPDSHRPMAAATRSAARPSQYCGMRPALPP